MTPEPVAQGSGPRVMRHAPLPDCKVRGMHYCHSRYKVKIAPCARETR